MTNTLELCEGFGEDAGEPRKKQKSNCASTVEAGLKEELERIKKRVGMGYEVQVKWLPNKIKYRKGKQLDEEVVGNTILIYTEKAERAVELTSHGFAEWILNQHSKPYRQLINSLITLFEEQQYEKKERIVEALTKLMQRRIKRSEDTRIPSV